MSTKMNRLFLRTRAAVPVVFGVLVLAALGAGVAARRTSLSSPAPPQVVKAAPAMPESSRKIADFESELITITPHGFEPQEITRPQGRFLLMIDNRSGLATTSLSLTREAGPQTQEMRVPRESPNWSDIVDLPAGRYLLTETDHPRWSCQFTITAR
jgi:hypothetical protein